MKLALAEEMRRLDRSAIEDYRLPSLILMENAGRGTVDTISNHLGRLPKRVVVVAGPGNNGGDGLVIARHLSQRGSLPLVYLLADPDKLTEDSTVNLEILRRLRIPLFIADDQTKLLSLHNHLQGCELIIDAIFGTGLRRTISGHYARAVELINASACPIVSADIPSGLNSDTGQIMGDCVMATLTATYGLAKPGHFLAPGNEATGILKIVDISLPTQAVETVQLRTEVLTAETASAWLIPRPRTAHKGTFGHLLIVAGSRGKTGAALLCARAGLRAGAGLVSLAMPTNLADTLVSALPEIMTLILANSPAGYAAFQDFSTIIKELPGKTALTIGPGLGRASDTARLAAELYHRVPLPMVVDADGLNLLVDLGVDLKDNAGPRILTPHPGEMSRLSGLSIEQMQADRLAVAREFAATHQVYLVLKGATTIVAAPDGRLAINSTGNQLLSTGGSGDVLAGLIGSLLAQGMCPWEAAGLGVFVHGLAADRRQNEERQTLGLFASELADELPRVFSKLSLQ